MTFISPHESEKYLQACLDQHRHFSRFVVSCNGVLGNEAKVVLQNLAGSIAKTSGKSYVFRNFNVHEVKDEHCNCTREATHLFSSSENHASPLRAE